MAEGGGSVIHPTRKIRQALKASRGEHIMSCLYNRGKRTARGCRALRAQTFASRDRIKSILKEKPLDAFNIVKIICILQVVRTYQENIFLMRTVLHPISRIRRIGLESFHCVGSLGEQVCVPAEQSSTHPPTWKGDGTVRFLPVKENKRRHSKA